MSGHDIFQYILFDPLHRGHATVDEEKGVVIINHLEGFSLHQLNSGLEIATYTGGQSRTTLPKPAVFGEGSRVVITGSDHGKVYIFDKKGGEPTEILEHASTDLVQSITVHSKPLSLEGQC